MLVNLFSHLLMHSFVHPCILQQNHLPTHPLPLNFFYQHIYPFIPPPINPFTYPLISQTWKCDYFCEICALVVTLCFPREALNETVYNAQGVGVGNTAKLLSGFLITEKNDSLMAHPILWPKLNPRFMCFIFNFNCNVLPNSWHFDYLTVLL